MDSDALMPLLEAARWAPAEELPEKLREREKPSGRIRVSEFAHEGKWRG